MLYVLLVTVFIKMLARVVVVLPAFVALTQLLAQLALLLDKQLATGSLSVKVLIKEVFWQIFMCCFVVECILTDDSAILGIPGISVFFC